MPIRLCNEVAQAAAERASKRELDDEPGDAALAAWQDRFDANRAKLTAGTPPDEVVAALEDIVEDSLAFIRNIEVHMAAFELVRRLKGGTA